MLRKLAAGIFLGLLVLTTAAILTAPAKLINHAQAEIPATDLDQWLSVRESLVNQTTPIIPQTEKIIHWFNDQVGSKTRRSLVYIHGFSATRQEIAPVAALVADALRANLFETRLSGHGLVQDPLANVRAEDWLDDAAEALSIGAEIGSEIIVMGTSTGASLILAMKDHTTFKPVSTIVLMSPNFAPSDRSAELLTWPGGPQLAHFVAGDIRSWTPANELQARFWSTTYPMDAVIEMMRLVKYARAKLPMQLEAPLLVFYSPQDTVVDTQWITDGFEQMNSPRRRLVEISASGDRSNHVLAGYILAAENNEPIASQIVEFVLADEIQ